MKNDTQTLPLELIIEILMRLPVRSVLGFKCVCKSWFSLISDPQFGISHFDLAASPTHRLLQRCNHFYAESIDTEAPLKKYSSAVHFLLPPPSPPHHGEYDNYADYQDKHEILGSCRGLVLLYYKRYCDLILWNPSIGAHKRSPNFAYDITFQFLYGFGYDPSTDEYLLMMIGLYESGNYKYDNGNESEDHECKGNYQIFSFKTDSWYIDDVFVPYKDLGDKFRAGSLFDETLHWLVFSEDKKIPVILAFDLILRSFSEIPLFDHFTMEKYEIYSLRVMGGCLCVCCLVQGYENAEIWVMKEYKVQSSWTKSIVIPTSGFSPLRITKDGGILGSNTCGRLEKLNYKGELHEHLNYGGGQWLYSANLQSAVYRESLLSLPSVVRVPSKDDHGKTSEDDQQ